MKRKEDLVAARLPEELVKALKFSRRLSPKRFSSP